MRKGKTVIWISAALAICVISAAAGFLLSSLLLPRGMAVTVAVSEEERNIDEVSDEEAGYEIPPVSAAETLPEFGQWKQNESGQYTYENPDGSLAVDWQEIDGAWYYFDQGGIMQTGWLELEGAWYYLDGDGEMLTGWVKDQGTWYYLDESGVMRTNYDTPDGYWVDSSGALAVKP